MLEFEHNAEKNKNMRMKLTFCVFFFDELFSVKTLR